MLNGYDFFKRRIEFYAKQKGVSLSVAFNERKGDINFTIFASRNPSEFKRLKDYCKSRE